jgi:hypothetical protein
MHLLDLTRNSCEKSLAGVEPAALRFRCSALKPVFHFARIVPKRTGEHAQIEKRFINPRTSGCIQHRGKTSAHAPNYENMAGNLNINF